jgi:hypothetical protein
MASSSVRKRIVAVCQITATNNKEDNMRTCSELIKSAKEKNCMVWHNCYLVYLFCLKLLMCRLRGKGSSFGTPTFRSYVDCDDYHLLGDDAMWLL